MNKKAKMLIVCFCWFILVGLGSVITKLFILTPAKKEAKQKLLDDTSSENQYKHDIKIACDGFSGYAILRSPVVKNDLKSKGIRLLFEDDKADYSIRINSCKNKDVQLATFTIDSLITACSQISDFPVSIILIIDETKGADTIIANKSIKSIQDLDRPDSKFVFVPNSPSEFMSRIVIANFSLPRLSQKWWQHLNNPDDIVPTALSSSKQPYAFVTWEPYASKILQNGQMHVLMDSSKISGYIVDVLVAERVFLKEHPDLVKYIMEAYLRAVYHYAHDEKEIVNLIVNDSNQFGTNITDDQAKKLSSGIKWKNTSENFAHFGLINSQSSSCQNIQDMIISITDVLLKTGAIGQDPVNGRENVLFYDKLLSALQSDGFHPNRKLNLIDTGTNNDEAIADIELPPLTSEQWAKLINVGNIKVNSLSFGRGTAELTIQSQRELRNLVDILSSFPQYYLTITGHAVGRGDADENLKLASMRSDVVSKYLQTLGLNVNRIRAKTSKPSRDTESSVSFTVGQMPY